MAKYELKLPKMGESIAEATVTNWLKEVGERIEMDDAVVEIATDKVDSEVPSEVEGVLVEKLFEIDDVVQIGQAIAIIETETRDISKPKIKVQDQKTANIKEEHPTFGKEENPIEVEGVAAVLENQISEKSQNNSTTITETDSSKFYSPLVKNIAAEENITTAELSSISGTGKDGRVTKNDILEYLADRTLKTPQPPQQEKVRTKPSETQKQQADYETKYIASASPIVSGEDEIIEMTRLGKMVANHMVSSIQTAAHVQSFIEVDVTRIWNWRNKVKDDFMNREGEKLTFTPIFMEAVAKAIKDFPLINISVHNNETVIKKKNINLGMAAALPDGNLIVPVIKNADQLNLVGMTKKVNDLANRARNKQLKPEDTQNGTYTVTNIGTFGSLMGTPIINQPQVAILALGAIRKVPAVIETPDGDFIGIRHKMFLSHSYDHRVINGALGGQFVLRVKEYLEAFNENREF